MDITKEEVEALARKAIKDIDPNDVKSPALRRLLEDLRDESGVKAGYNRIHNRHNRGR